MTGPAVPGSKRDGRYAMSVEIRCGVELVERAKRHGWCCMDLRRSLGCMVLMHSSTEKVVVVFEGLITSDWAEGVLGGESMLVCSRYQA
jgi:hypothetical protein